MTEEQIVGGLAQESDGVWLELDVFSGFPNPFWRLPDKYAAELEGLLRDLETSVDATGVRQLGYRGFVVRNIGEEFQIPEFVRIRRGVVELHSRGESSFFADTPGLEAWALNVRLLRNGEFPDMLREEGVFPEIAFPEEASSIGFASRFLKAMQTIRVPSGTELHASQIQAAVFREFIPEMDVSDLPRRELAALYVSTLRDNGACYQKVVETDPLPDLTQGDCSVFFPRFETDFRFVAYGSRSNIESMRKLCRRTAVLLDQMGTGPAFSRVYVTDDMKKLAEKLGIPRPLALPDGHALIASAFPKGKGGIGLPILLIHSDIGLVALHAALMHEVMHVFLHHSWQLDKLYQSFNPIDHVAPQLLCESFAHMMATKNLGAEYLFTSLLLSIPPGKQRRGLPEMESEDLHWLEGDDLRAWIFLASFPWVAASWVLDEQTPPTIIQKVKLLWDSDTAELADRLKPILLSVFETASVSSSTYNQIRDLLGTQGPCGEIFIEPGTHLMFDQIAIPGESPAS